MTSKKEFLNEKLNNMIEWIDKERIMGKNHPLYSKLKSFKNNFDGFFDFVVTISQYADADGGLSDEYMNLFFESHGLNYQKLDKDKADKLGRYIKCFIKTVRNN